MREIGFDWDVIRNSGVRVVDWEFSRVQICSRGCIEGLKCENCSFLSKPMDNSKLWNIYKHQPPKVIREGDVRVSPPFDLKKELFLPHVPWGGEKDFWHTLPSPKAYSPTKYKKYSFLIGFSHFFAFVSQITPSPPWIELGSWNLVCTFSRGSKWAY